MSKIIAVVNFKGGVGKSTLASIIQTNIENSVVFNIDNQDAEKVNPGDTINVLDYIENENASIEELLRVTEEDYDVVIVDAPGELNEYFVQLLDRIDCFIIPFMDEERVINTTKDTMKALFNGDVFDKKQNVLLIHNSFTKDDNKNTADEIISEVLKDDDVIKDIEFQKTIFEYSKAIKKMTKEKKSISKLKEDNYVAYRIIDKRVKKLMSQITNFIGE